MEKKFLPTNDLLFKKLFASKGNEEILLHFINDFTEEKFTKVSINNPYTIDQYKKERTEKTTDLYTTIVDVSATTDAGVEIIIEMQLQNHLKFIERSVFYAMNGFVKEYSHDQHYNALKPVYAINIVHFNLFDTEKFIEEFAIMNLETKDYLLNKNRQPLFKIFYVMLPNLAKLNIREMWRQFFMTGDVPNNAPDYLIKAKNTVSQINLSTEEQQMITKEQIRQADAKAIMEYELERANEIGLQQGIQQGIEKGVLLTAKNMLLNGISKELVGTVTGLPAEKIESLSQLHEFD